MSDLLGIGVSGLQAFKRELDTTSHNITNVNTEGYSRQRVDLVTRPPNFTGYGYTGNGVDINGVRRVVDEFLNTQILDNSTNLSQTALFEELTSRVDQLLANADVGLMPSLQGFFNAAQEVADDPTSIPARQVMLFQGEILVDRLNAMDKELTTMERQTNSMVATSLVQVNSIADGIAQLNRQISTAFSGTNTPPNDLLDKRDQLIRELAEKINVSVINESNGAMNVFIGTGQALVIGNDARTLAAVNNAFDPAVKDITISDGSTPVLITEQMQGGSIGGALDFLNKILYPTRSELGRIAIGMAGSFNAQNRLGQDLDGNPGGDFFQALNTGSLRPDVLDDVGNSVAGFGVMSASFVDVNQLTSSNYEVRALSGGQYEVTRLSDKQVSLFSTNTFTVDGVQISFSSPPLTGDSFLVRPSFQGARNLKMGTVDPRSIAAASPVRGAADLNNTGSGKVSAVQLTDATTYVPDTYTVTWGAANSYSVVNSGGTTVASGTYSAGTPIAFNGIALDIAGVPGVGDQFTVERNIAGVGDNRNMLQLAALQNVNTMDNGNSTYLDLYGRMVSSVGSRAQQASITRDAQQVLYDQSIAARESMSGVNLDEEAAALIRFQQAYQAAAQVINTANELFQTLIGAVRG